MAVSRPSQNSNSSSGVGEVHAHQRNGRGVSEDRRLESSPGREDFTSPYARGSNGVAATTKGAYLGGDSAGGSNLYRWVAALGGENDINRPYAQHAWIYSCVAAIGRTASSVPVRMQRRLGDGEFETVYDTPLSRVFDLPNPLQSQRKFFRSVATSHQLYGETFLILLKKDRDGRMVTVDAVGGTSGMTAMVEPPEEIWPVRGDMVDALLDPKTKLPAVWRFGTATGYVDYPAHAIVQIAEVNPYNPLRGMGPMQAAYRTAAKDFVIDRYDEALLQNGGSPGGVLSVDGPLTDADQRAIREAWHEAHGRPESNRKTAVLPKGTQYKEIGLSPAEMEHEKLRLWDRQTILSIFGVPPVVLGLESMNYATSREQHRIFWENTITPYLSFLQDELQYKLVRRIAGPDADLIINFDLSGVAALREDVDAKVNRTIKLYTEGHRTFLEAARLAGWELDESELTVSDERWVPSSLVPAEVGAMMSDDQEDEEGDVEEFEDPYEEAEEERSLVGMCVDPPRLDTKGRPECNAVNLSWPPHLDTEEKRTLFDSLIGLTTAHAERFAKKAQQAYRDIFLAARKQLKELAAGVLPEEVEGDGRPIITQAEIARCLHLDGKKWRDYLEKNLLPVMGRYAQELSEELEKRGYAAIEEEKDILDCGGDRLMARIFDPSVEAILVVAMSCAEKQALRAGSLKEALMLAAPEIEGELLEYLAALKNGATFDANMELESVLVDLFATRIPEKPHELE